MTAKEREDAINAINEEIFRISEDWIYLGIKLQTKTFVENEDPKVIERQWNDIDNRLYTLNKDRRSLQTEYYVDFFNDRNILTTALILLNRKVDIDTQKNGWEFYRNNKEARQVLYDIHKILSETVSRPGINRITTN